MDQLLRPRSPIEIIDAAFALYRAHFAVIATLSLVLLGPFEVIGALVGGTAGDIIANASGFFTPIVVGAVVAVVSDTMHDRPISVGGAFGQIAGKWGTLVLVNFVTGLMVILGTLVLVVPGVFAFCWTFAAPMAVVVEGANRVQAAIDRSSQLAKGHFWHILRTLGFAWIIVLVLFIAISIAVEWVGGMMGLSDDMISFLGSWAFILLLPIAATTSGVLYFDLRIRSEAYDLERLAQQVIDVGRAPTP
jgi:hypothetical protein